MVAPSIVHPEGKVLPSRLFRLDHFLHNLSPVFKFEPHAFAHDFNGLYREVAIFTRMGLPFRRLECRCNFMPFCEAGSRTLDHHIEGVYCATLRLLLCGKSEIL